MKVAYLVRHAQHDLLGRRLAGRTPGVRLNAEGRVQAAALAERFAEEAFAAVQTSTLERCAETAAPIAARLGAPLEPVEALNEIDFGDWSGRSFADLEGDAAWAAWNARRGAARCPGGESMLEAQLRIVRHLERLPEGRFALVTHGDMVRAALCWALGVPLDFICRLEAAPASWSAIDLEGGAPRVLWLNRTC